MSGNPFIQGKTLSCLWKFQIRYPLQKLPFSIRARINTVSVYFYVQRLVCDSLSFNLALISIFFATLLILSVYLQRIYYRYGVNLIRCPPISRVVFE